MKWAKPLVSALMKSPAAKYIISKWPKMPKKNNYGPNDKNGYVISNKKLQKWLKMH